MVEARCAQSEFAEPGDDAETASAVCADAGEGCPAWPQPAANAHARATTAAAAIRECVRCMVSLRSGCRSIPGTGGGRHRGFPYGGGRNQFATRPLLRPARLERTYRACGSGLRRSDVESSRACVSRRGDGISLTVYLRVPWARPPAMLCACHGEPCDRTGNLARS